MEFPNEIYTMMFNYLSATNKRAIIRVCKIWYFIIYNLTLSKYNNNINLIHNIVDTSDHKYQILLTNFYDSMIVYIRYTNDGYFIRTIHDTEFYISKQLFLKYRFLNYNPYENHFVVWNQDQCFRPFGIIDPYTGIMKQQTPYAYVDGVVSREYYAGFNHDKIGIGKLINVQYTIMNPVRIILVTIFSEDIVIKGKINDYCLAGTDKFAILYNNNTVEWIDAIKKERKKITG